MQGKPLLKDSEKPRKQRKKSLSKLRKELDRIFSIYIRQKYAKEGKVKCFTCNHVGDVGQMQAGHFVSRSYLATRYDERNVRPQCVGCNIFGGGRSAEFANNLENDCEGITAILYRKAKEITKWSAKDYEERIEHYKSLIK